MNRQEKEALKQEKINQAMYMACACIIKRKPKINFMGKDLIEDLQKQYQTLIDEGLKVLNCILDKAYIFKTIAMTKSERSKISHEFFNIMQSLGYTNGNSEYEELGEVLYPYSNGKFKTTLLRNYHSFNKDSRIVLIEYAGIYSNNFNPFIYLDFSIRDTVGITLHCHGLESIYLSYDVFTRSLESLGSISRLNVLSNISEAVTKDCYRSACHKNGIKCMKKNEEAMFEYLIENLESIKLLV